MNTHELSDLDADALTITTRGAHTWVTCTSEGEEVTVGPFPTRKLTSALPRHGDDMDGGVTAALIEKEAERGTRGTATDSALAHYWLKAYDRAEARAEKAEKERDEWRVRAGAAEPARDKWREVAKRKQRMSDELARQLEATEASLREANGVVESLRTAKPRPLGPDAITDEMVERAVSAVATLGWSDNYSDYRAEVREALTAALIEPPARPEGAVTLAARLDEAHKGGGDVQDEADRLYAMGVRVVGEERS